MLYVSLTFSAVLFVATLIAVAQSRDRRRTYPKVWFGALFGVVPCLCILPAYVLHAVLLGATAMACRWTGAELRGFTCGSIASVLISYAVIAVPRAIDVVQVADQYPLESLEERMGYESRWPARPSRTTPITADDDDDFSSMNHWSIVGREEILRQLHEEKISLFASTPASASPG